MFSPLLGQVLFIGTMRMPRCVVHIEASAPYTLCTVRCGGKQFNHQHCSCSQEEVAFVAVPFVYHGFYVVCTTVQKGNNAVVPKTNVLFTRKPPETSYPPRRHDLRRSHHLIHDRCRSSSVRLRMLRMPSSLGRRYPPPRLRTTEVAARKVDRHGYPCPRKVPGRGTVCCPC